MPLLGFEWTSGTLRLQTHAAEFKAHIKKQVYCLQFCHLFANFLSICKKGLNAEFSYRIQTFRPSKSSSFIQIKQWDSWHQIRHFG